MVYWIFATGFATGLYMRHNDKDSQRSAETSETARRVRDNLYNSFHETIWGTQRETLNLSPFKFQTSIGKFFDEISNKYIINGLYRADLDFEIKTVSSKDSSDKKD